MSPVRNSIPSLPLAEAGPVKQALSILIPILHSGKAPHILCNCPKDSGLVSPLPVYRTHKGVEKGGREAQSEASAGNTFYNLLSGCSPWMLWEDAWQSRAELLPSAWMQADSVLPAQETTPTHAGDSISRTVVPLIFFSRISVQIPQFIETIVILKILKDWYCYRDFCILLCFFSLTPPIVGGGTWAEHLPKIFLVY